MGSLPSAACLSSSCRPGPAASRQPGSTSFRQLYDGAYDEIELTAQSGERLPYRFRRRRGDRMVGHYRERLDASQIDLRLDRICGQVDHRSQWVDEILSLTKVQSGGMKPVLEPKLSGGKAGLRSIGVVNSMADE